MYFISNQSPSSFADFYICKILEIHQYLELIKHIWWVFKINNTHIFLVFPWFFAFRFIFQINAHINFTFFQKSRTNWLLNLPQIMFILSVGITISFITIVLHIILTLNYITKYIISIFHRKFGGGHIRFKFVQ